jgi:hypothetical protein
MGRRARGAAVTGMPARRADGAPADPAAERVNGAAILVAD